MICCSLQQLRTLCYVKTWLAQREVKNKETKHSAQFIREALFHRKFLSTFLLILPQI